MRAVNRDLATVSGQLNGERDELGAALQNLALALGQVQSFVRDNRDNLKANIEGLAQVTGVLVQQKEALTEFLDVAPPGLQNLAGTFNPERGTLDTRNDAEQTQDPRLFVCEILKSFGKGCGLIPPLPGVPGPGGIPGPASYNGPDLTLGGILGRTP